VLQVWKENVVAGMKNNSRTSCLPRVLLQYVHLFRGLCLTPPFTKENYNYI
jgi:hypothetical protein